MSTVLDNKDVTMYLGQQALAEMSGVIVDSSVRKSRAFQDKAERLRYYLKAMQYEEFLEDSEIISLLQCIEKLAEITEWPTAPILTEKDQPTILLGIPGADGQDGAPGAPGSDADIVVEADTSYDNMSIIETTINGVKTYRLGYAPYTQPTISLSVGTGSLPNPNSLVQELNRVITNVPVTITTDKGRDLVVSSTVTNPAALDTQYQASWDLAQINAGNQQVVGVNDTLVSASTTYTAQITDEKASVASASQTLTFVVPFLTGASSTLLIQTTMYAALNKLVQTQGNKSVLFNATDSYFYFAYDANYPDLSDILDGNGFSAIAAFTKTTENINMFDDVVTSMKVYRSAITDIVNQTYTFKF